jgi:hypothetical protein
VGKFFYFSQKLTDIKQDQTTLLKEELHTIEELPVEWQL